MNNVNKKPRYEILQNSITGRYSVRCYRLRTDGALEEVFPPSTLDSYNSAAAAERAIKEELAPPPKVIKVIEID